MIDFYEAIRDGSIRVTKKSPAILRFWKYLSKDGPIHSLVGQCWKWLGYKTKENGYGQFQIDGVNVLSHRYSYQLHYDKIPEGLFVLHHCDNKGCVNPSHLFVGTIQDNTDDMINKGRSAESRKGEDHCMRKLKEEEVIEIRQRYKRGSRTNGGGALGKEYGITQSQISNIVNNLHWRHI